MELKFPSSPPSLRPHRVCSCPHPGVSFCIWPRRSFLPNSPLSVSPRASKKLHSIQIRAVSPYSVGGRVDNLPRDERELDHRLSEQSSGAPPNYEEATRDVHNQVQENSGVKAAAPTAPSSSVPNANSPPLTLNQGSPSVPTTSSSIKIENHGSGNVSSALSKQTNSNNNGFDEFDPRGSASAAPPAASSPEMDLFGSASDSIYSLALVPLTTMNTELETGVPENSDFGAGFAAKSSVPAGFSQIPLETLLLKLLKKGYRVSNIVLLLSPPLILQFQLEELKYSHL